ncbi:hypothetical protein SYNPS1DRAFT_29072 [Syncephalis pseudoplumigaleata]|uniref:RRM domain-containing protein n=1 Tax=Syncephalis pseudoplumigaleata TaxID=1712513 RepID=A0A4P9YYQ1_9FUNG|nr:hypothetical protein SYNPS1DRAFT_29072 [Syncephalis pseudoplumigaleata]|eukprot:RKP25184.1 hypothetical protein SYNPS1DRAFT_29072 [Syncephalis pseudoplumigaleata]
MANSRSDGTAPGSLSGDSTSLVSQAPITSAAASMSDTIAVTASMAIASAALAVSISTPAISTTNASVLPPAPGLPAPAPGASGIAPADDICTIFVVGFPDDMTEREFQNMFTFCPGFEAAMLKTPPTPASTDEPTPSSSGNDGNGANAGSGSSSTSSSSTSTSTATSALPANATTAAAAAAAASSAGTNQKKPLRIGFAKFRTRLTALEARNVLNGRKVDLQSGAVLRAELAKKNLQMKRITTLSNGFEVGSGGSGGSASAGASGGIGFPILPTDRSASSMAGASQRFHQSASDSAAFNAFYSVPTTPGSLGNEMMRKDYSNSFDFFGDAFMSPTGDENRRFDLPSLAGMVGTPSTRSMSFSHPAGRLANGQDSFSSVAAAAAAGAFTGAAPNAATAGPASASVDGSGYPMLSRSNSTSATTRTFFGREISGGTITGGNAADRPPNSATLKSTGGAQGSIGPGVLAASGDDQLSPLSGRLNQLSINTQMNNLYNGSAPVVGPMSAPAITAPRNPIPADQNPPCNTLYVGNLPVNAQEDELRRLFSRMRGYKRLCFRPKPGTGPMCFVEFDDIPCATHAMNELYGVPLSNSVKGGIRLSYSKNPLGVRQNFGPSGAAASSGASSSQNSSQQFQSQQQQQQQQLQQLRQAHLSALTSTNGHSHLSLAQQQQLAQLKAAVAMKQRLEGGSGPGVPMTGGPVDVGRAVARRQQQQQQQRTWQRQQW